MLYCYYVRIIFEYVMRQSTNKLNDRRASFNALRFHVAFSIVWHTFYVAYILYGYVLRI